MPEVQPEEAGMRRAAKRDMAEPGVVSDLEAAGCMVYRELPSDLLIHRPTWGAGWFRVQEVKDPKAYADKRQKKQAAFLAATGVSKVRTAEDALKDVGLMRADSR